VIVFFAAVALGRTSVIGVADLRDRVDDETGDRGTAWRDRADEDGVRNRRTAGDARSDDEVRDRGTARDARADDEDVATEDRPGLSGSHRRP
jgi:hypothetical protein